MSRRPLFTAAYAATLCLAALLRPALAETAPPLAWTQTYDGPAHGNDIAQKIAADGNGNVYVAGSSQGTGTGSDYALVKYAPDGTLLWTRRFSGAGGDNTVSGLAVSPSGDVYVGGSSQNAAGNYDFVTLKYDGAGNILWTARFDGTARGDDTMAALALDPSGNVVVVGTSQGTPGDTDYKTIEYSPTGRILWQARQDGTAHGNDFATAVAIDRAGSVYVTGGAQNVGTGEDYYTVKYDHAGHKIWKAVYNGYGYEYATAICVDKTGHMFVSGTAESHPAGFTDLVTVKFTTGGQIEYANRYFVYPNDVGLAAIAIVIDGNNDAIAIARVLSFDPVSDSPDYYSNFLTIKYGKHRRLWIARSGGSDFQTFHELRGIVLDANNNIYVTGYNQDGFYVPQSSVVIKYNPSGAMLWQQTLGTYANQYSGNSIALDLFGNVLVAGATHTYNRVNGMDATDFLTLKYAP